MSQRGWHFLAGGICAAAVVARGLSDTGPTVATVLNAFLAGWNIAWGVLIGEQR